MDLVRYQREDGAEPFTDWLGSLRDKAAQARVRVRLLRIAAGAFGDSEPVGGGVSELRIHEAAGYRVYFGRHGKTLVILLCGGDKGSQSADIRRAKEYWAEWKRRQA
jgi:putative addiction module killer protein